MSFVCECGEKFKETPDGLAHKAHVLPAQEWEVFWSAVDAVMEKPPATPREKEITRLRLRETLHSIPACQCARCGRLYVQDFEGKFRLFLPMSPSTPTQILKKRG